MSSNPLSKLIQPRYPAAAVGLESALACVVQLERRRHNTFALKRAASITLPEGLIRPSFEEPNIGDINELAEALAELVNSAGLGRRSKWSVALPEATTHSIVLGFETAVPSRRELEEVLQWKTERGFGVSLAELRVVRDRLPPDPQGKERYIVTGVRKSVLGEYESLFAALGWRAGLIVPRHLGEARWLVRGKPRGDSLLVSSHTQGFTAVFVRGTHQFIVRSVLCEAEDCADELYRLLLFYRDRNASVGMQESQSIEGLLVTGDGFEKDRVSDIVNDTLGGDLRPLEAAEVGLALPGRDLNFDAIAAPTGLATLAWG
jgi:hypothetical protein